MPASTLIHLLSPSRLTLVSQLTAPRITDTSHLSPHARPSPAVHGRFSRSARGAGAGGWGLPAHGRVV